MSLASLRAALRRASTRGATGIVTWQDEFEFEGADPLSATLGGTGRPAKGKDERVKDSRPTPPVLTDRVFSAVLFDNDGTLIDSTPAVVRSWTTWAQEYGVEALGLTKYHGVPAAAIIAQVAPHLDQAAALQRIIELEEGDTDGVLALPGAVAAVRALVGRAAVVTSATHSLALARLQAAGIPIPEVLVTADDITRGKPDPEPYLLAAGRLGVDAADCLVIEDAPSGLAAARAARCSTLAVTTTVPPEDLSADLIVQDLAAVTFTRTSAGITLSLS